MSFLYIDIETIPGPSKPSPADVSVPASYKKPESIKAYQQNNVETEWRKQSLHPLKGRILCVGWAVDDGPVDTAVFEDEVRLMSMLSRVVESQKTLTWFGHNVAGFDLPWIKLRAVKYGFDHLANSIRIDRYRGNYVDTMELAGG